MVGHKWNAPSPVLGGDAREQNDVPLSVDGDAAMDLYRSLIATGMEPSAALLGVAGIIGPGAALPVFDDFTSLMGSEKIMEHLKAFGESDPDAARHWLQTCLDRRDITGWDTSHGLEVRLEGLPWVTHLPDGLQLRCGLAVDGCDAIRHLSVGMRVCGYYLSLHACPGFTSFPDDLVAKVEILDVTACPSWDGVIPQGVSAGIVHTDAHPIGMPLADWRVFHPKGERCPLDPAQVNALAWAFRAKLVDPEGLPPRDALLEIAKHAPGVAQECAEAWMRSDDAIVQGVRLDHAGWLTSIPEDFTATRHAVFEHCPSLVAFPTNLSTWQDLRIVACEGVRVMPGGWTIGGNFVVQDCVGLEAITQGVDVKGFVNLDGCCNLKHLPNGMRVGGDLILSGCKAWDGKLPKDCQVGGVIVTDKHPGGISQEEWRDRLRSSKRKAVEKDGQAWDVMASECGMDASWLHEAMERLAELEERVANDPAFAKKAGRRAAKGLRAHIMQILESSLPRPGGGSS